MSKSDAELADLLAEFTNLLNKDGDNSSEVQAFMDRYADDDDFTDLAGRAVRLRLALRPSKLSRVSESAAANAAASNA